MSKETKDNKEGKSPMNKFFKELCMEMKEETKRVKKLVEDGRIKPLPDKEGMYYDVQENK